LQLLIYIALRIGVHHIIVLEIPQQLFDWDVVAISWQEASAP